VTVSVVLDNLAQGVETAEILRNYPGVTPEDINACLAYAAELVRERVLPLTPK